MLAHLGKCPPCLFRWTGSSGRCNDRQLILLCVCPPCQLQTATSSSKLQSSARLLLEQTVHCTLLHAICARQHVLTGSTWYHLSWQHLHLATCMLLSSSMPIRYPHRQTKPSVRPRMAVHHEVHHAVHRPCLRPDHKLANTGLDAHSHIGSGSTGKLKSSGHKLLKVASGLLLLAALLALRQDLLICLVCVRSQALCIRAHHRHHPAVLRVLEDLCHEQPSAALAGSPLFMCE